MRTTQTRLERLERAVAARTGERLPYLAVDTEVELEALLDDPSLPPGAYKVYIGFSPDDWDAEGTTDHDDDRKET